MVDQYQQLAEILSKEIPKGGKEETMEISPEELDRVAQKAAVSAVALYGQKVSEQLARQQETEGIHHSPVSPHCQRVLDSAPPCWGWREIRSWVMCRAFELMDKERLSRLPVGRAWQDARIACYLTETEIPSKKEEIKKLRGR